MKHNSAQAARASSTASLEDLPEGVEGSDPKQLADRLAMRPAFDILRTWVALLLLIWVAVASENFWVIALSMPVIGALQYALLIIMHDGQHRLLHRRASFNDHIAKWLIAAPCGASFETSRAQHLAHHRAFGDARRDPAYAFYCYGEPSPKNSRTALLFHFAHSLAVGRVLYSILGRRKHEDGLRNVSAGVPGSYLGAVLPVQIIILTLFWACGAAWAYMILWVVPLVFFASLFDAVRQFVEHSVPAPDEGNPDRLFSIRAGAIDRFFFAPFNMNYHAEHHLYPYVPYYRLPELSKLIETSRQAVPLQVRFHYARHLLEAISRPRRDAAASQ